DSTGAPSACEALLEGGTTVYCVGYNVDMLSVAPKAALTSAQNNWSVYYTYAFTCMLNGEDIATDWAKGYSDGAVMISTLGESCAEGTAEKVAEVEAALKDGTLNVFDTANFTVGGETVTSYMAIDTDGDWVGDTGEAIVNGIFEESVLRSAPYFGLRIDGITELNAE
ncbi:MAG TPA: BMP family ABC transporter substrate-binding protein, partial [Candidatus Limiplasma sp.]|nr:BMP family ABC transporter substrate-binding protein [Candidatus Limiplasma sp.]